MIITAASSALALVLSLQAVSADDQVDAQTVPAAPPVEAAEAPKDKITDRSDPEYIRCRREPVIGSRARTTKRCMTNRQWAELSTNGNRDARQIVEDLQVGSNSN